MKLSDFQYELPEGMIAKYPAKPRDASRLLVLPPAGPFEHVPFRALPSFLKEGDVLVVNDTRVVQARLLGHRAAGGEAEVFLLRPASESGLWEALVRPGRRLRAGARVLFGDDGTGVEILRETGPGRRLVRAVGSTFDLLMRHYGLVPLPPYIRRSPEGADSRRYQTVYARAGVSVAAPTAGLHFTPRVLGDLARQGIQEVRIRLDVGPGTFKPVTTEDVEQHVMDPEPYFISEDSAASLNAALREGRRLVAVGTTVTRTLEDQLARFGKVRPGAYETDLFIRPGFQFKAVSALLTNFHLPGSTLLMLVSAFAGRKRVLQAYGEAVRLGYRFYSYGDAMLLWK